MESKKLPSRNVAEPVLFLENEFQVKDFINRFGDKKMKIVALSPFAVYELEKNNVPYRILEDYYNPKDLYKFGLDNYQKVEKICSMIDDSLQKTFPELAKIDFRPAFYNIYSIKLTYDAIAIRLFQLSKFIEKENPKTMKIYNAEERPFDRIKLVLPIFDNYMSLYAKILTSFYGEEISMLPEIPYDIARTNPATSKLIKLSKYPNLYELFTLTRKLGYKVLLRALKNAIRPPADKILLFGGSYNWAYSRKEFESKDMIFSRFWDESMRYGNVSFPSELDAEKLSSMWNELKRNKEFRELFEFQGISFLSVLESRLVFLIEHLTPTLLDFYKKNMKMFKIKKMKAAITSAISDGFHHVISKAAHDSNIPIITWQHGGNYGYTDNPIIIYLDLIAPDFHFVFGNGVVKTYGKYAKKYNTKLISIGSAFLENLKTQNIPKRAGKFKGKNKIILYALTSGYQNSLYISIPPPFSNNQYWQTEKKITDILGKYKNYNALIKLFPGGELRESLLPSYAKDRGYECRFIKNDCYFKELLPVADVIVIDFPSTPLLEALMTDKTIFVYGGHMKLHKDALRLLKKRVYFSEDLEEFTEMLDSYLSGGKMKQRPDLNNKDFIREYGIGNFKSGSAAERAAKCIKEIIHKRVI